VRVPGKNIALLAGHPLLAYSIAGARHAGVFDDVIVSTDSDEIAAVAHAYGAAVHERPAELATSESPDIAWVLHVMRDRDDDVFSILRPTSPFRTAATIRRAWDRFATLTGFDSIRAIEPVRQHPGKMWLVDGDALRPLLEQGDGEVPFHSTQLAALPRVWVQNSSLELARSRVLAGDRPSIAGDTITAFFTEGHEGFSIDYPDDLARAEQLVARGEAELPPLDSPA
jgi:N-acylneuraminate cytidylyltransferase